MSDAPSKNKNFVNVKLAEVRRETPELAHVALSEVPPEWLDAYTTPGQYVPLKEDAKDAEGARKPGFFAIACGPGRGRLEFLIKRGAPLADALLEKSPGETLALGAPAGPGYPLAEARGHDLHLAGVGSGFAPLRAVLHAVLAEREAFRNVSFHYGARTAASFPYRRESAAWARHGIEFVPVCSQAAPGTWNGATGHIQDVLRARAPTLAPDACLFACGMKELIADLKELAPECGLPTERVFLNF